MSELAWQEEKKIMVENWIDGIGSSLVGILIVFGVERVIKKKFFQAILYGALALISFIGRALISSSTQCSPSSIQSPLLLPSDGGFYTGVGALLLVGVVVGAILIRRKSSMCEKCALCGKDLTNKVGPCPVCNDTRRLKMS